MCEPGSREIRAPRETDCGINGSAEPLRSRRRPMSTSLLWNLSTYELPVVIEDGMSGRSGQQKPGTARGSPRRSRTAKASRISRRAVKSRCAREWGGWGRLSDDGPGSTTRTGARTPGAEDYPSSTAVHYRAHGPAQYGIADVGHEMHEGRRQTGRRSAHAGSRLKLIDVREGPAWKASLPAVSGKTRRTEVATCKTGVFSRS